MGLVLVFCFWVFVIFGWCGVIPGADWSRWGVVILIYDFWVFVILGGFGFWRRKIMVDHHVHGSETPSRSNSLPGSCCYRPCFWVSSTFRVIGRCIFVSCFPIIQCFGWDDCRHHHHHHSHF